MTAKRDSSNRTTTTLGLIIAAGGVIGLVVGPHLVFFWVFAIAFGLAKLPEQVYRRWKGRRQM